ncbi:MAG TPA: M24 family metallopeptidase [Longimicrobiaceae bacterium]|nr:M24 family metallopeptidase [Longimicrobiaceae bacterium]
MAIVEETVSLTAETAARIQEELRARGLDGWLLYAFRDNNPIASDMMGLPALTRRYFVLVPAEGTPVALTHRIEQQPWRGWIGENRPYSTWRELEAALAELLGGLGRVAMEYSPGDAVPYVDRVPAGVLEMVRATGVEPVTSADLVSTFYARWSPEGEAAHRRAAVAVQETAHAAFRRIADAVGAGERITEWDVRGWIGGELARRGLRVGVDGIVAVNGNAANPHYGPSAEEHSEIRRGDLVLIDLWGKEGEDAIYADQTWMGYVGEEVPERLASLFATLRDAREAAVALLRERWEAEEPVHGWEVDEAAHRVLVDAGHADQVFHRTGHSIDRELHGSGPNIDNLETRDTRRLIPGVGFSVEPGLYFPGDVGFRTEIDVFMGPDGPEVTTPRPQRQVFALLAGEPAA